MKKTCNVCCHHCALDEGQTGACGARKNVSGQIVASNYGKLTALALDPIEKKPLARFYPGSRILSVGSYGCSLRCPFCQNYEISWSVRASDQADTARTVTPEDLVTAAKRYQAQGNIGLISPLSNHFCAECNRLRLTADGHLKPCLHSRDEISVKGMTEEEMAEAMRRAVAMKPKQHDPLSCSERSHAARQMNQIGG